MTVAIRGREASNKVRTGTMADKEQQVAEGVLLELVLTADGTDSGKVKSAAGGHFGFWQVNLDEWPLSAL